MSHPRSGLDRELTSPLRLSIAAALSRVEEAEFSAIRDAVDALPRRVPVPSLRPPTTQCLPTGVVLDGARVVVMADEGGVAEALSKKLA